MFHNFTFQARVLDCNAFISRSSSLIYLKMQLARFMLFCIRYCWSISVFRYFFVIAADKCCPAETTVTLVRKIRPNNCCNNSQQKNYFQVNEPAHRSHYFIYGFLHIYGEPLHFFFHNIAWIGNAQSSFSKANLELPLKNTSPQ